MFSSQIYCVTFVNHRCTGGFTYFALHFIHATFCIEPRSPRPDIRTYDRIILGTAIYAGSPNRKVTQFCQNNQPLLEQKVIGLFICCMNEEQEAEEMNKAFPEFLQRLSIPKAILGGEFQFDKMNFIERFLTKKIAKVNSSVSKLRYDAINEFTSQIKDNHLW